MSTRERGHARDEELLFNADLAWVANGINLHIAFRQRNTGHIYAAAPMVFTKIDDGAQLGPAALFLTKAEAQVLIDELWRCGTRPTEGVGSAGSMAAQARHLEDMRAVAFGLLGDEVIKP